MAWKKTRQTAVDLALIAAVIVALFPKLLFSPAVIAPPGMLTDIIIQEMGVSQFTGTELAAGRLPLWNPYVFLGYPHLAMGYAGVFYPSSVLYGIEFFPVVYKFDFLIHLFAGAAFMYWLARTLCTSRTAAVACGFYYIFFESQFKAAIEGHLSIIHFITYIPLGALCLVRVLQGGSMVWGWVWTLVLCIQVFAGYFQLLTYQLLAFGVFCVVELLRQFMDRRESKRVVLSRALVLLVGTLLGVAAGAVQLLPASELLSSESVRALGISDEFSRMGSSGMLDEFLSTLMWEESPMQARVLPVGFVLAFALFGVLQWRSRFMPALLASAGFATIVTLGADLPIYDLMRKLPIVGSLRAAHRMVLIVAFFLICMAGLGIDALANRTYSRGWGPRSLKAFCVIAALLGLFPVLSGFASTDTLFQFVLFTAIIGVFCMFSLEPGARAPILLAAILTAVGFDALRATRGKMPPVGDDGMYHFSNDWEAIARQSKGYDRFLVIPHPFQYMYELNPQLGSLYRERTLNGYGGLVLNRYENFFARSLNQPRVRWSFDGKYGGESAMPDPWLVDSAQVEALGTINVRYIIVTKPGAPLLDALVQASNDVRRFPMEEAVIYENRMASSPAYVLHKTAVDPDNAGRFKSSLSGMQLIDKSYGTTKYYEGVRIQNRPQSFGTYDRDVAVLDMPIALQLGIPTAGEHAEIVSYEPRRVGIETDIAAPGVLVLTDIMYPGWKCVVNGTREERVFAVNGVLRGVQVLPGDTSVVFTFEPGSFQRGLWISLSCGALWLAWGIGLMLRPRRNRSTLQRGDAAQGSARDPQNAVLQKS